MLTALRVLAALAIAVAAGIAVGLGWAFYADAAARRADPGLLAVGGLVALLFAAGALGAIAAVFAPREGA